MGMGDDQADFKAWGRPPKPIQSHNLPPPTTPRPPPPNPQVAAAHDAEARQEWARDKERIGAHLREKGAYGIVTEGERLLARQARQQLLEAAISRLSIAAFNAGAAATTLPFEGAKAAQDEHTQAYVALSMLLATGDGA